MSIEELVYKLRTHSDPYQTMVEAADKLEELAAENEQAAKQRDMWIETALLQQRKREEAEAALSEKDKEIAALREAAREAVNCITHHSEDNENTRWVLSLLNTALAQGGQR